jgi:short-subunit dehydrogenase
MKKAIVIGASSGIGRELAKVLANHGYIVGLTGRRIELLNSLQKEIKTQTFVCQFDVQKFNTLIQQLGGLDLFVHNAGTGHINPELELIKDLDTINVNVQGFTAMANLSYNYFKKQGHGQLVGISSIAALGGNSTATAYSASKAYMSNYLQGLQKKSVQDRNNVEVLEVLPGFVDTEMAKAAKKFWVATPQKAAEQIYDAIKDHKTKVYVTKRWRLIGWLFKLSPSWLYNRMG